MKYSFYLPVLILLLFFQPIYGQHFVSINTGFGNKLKYEHEAESILSSSRVFSVGASYFYTGAIKKIRFEVGAEFQVFGFTTTRPHVPSPGFSYSYTAKSLNFGYLAVSTITNVVFQSPTFLPKFKLVLGPGISFSPYIDGNYKSYNRDRSNNNILPPTKNDLFLDFNLDNNEMPISVMLRAAIAYSITSKNSKLFQFRLGVSHFITPIAQGNYQFYDSLVKQSFGKVRLMPTQITFSCAYSF